MTEQEVRQKLETVQLKMAHLKGTIDRAKADYQSGKEVDKVWFNKLRYAKRMTGIEIQNLQVELGKLKTAERKKNGQLGLNVEKAFFRIARSRLDESLFEELFSEAEDYVARKQMEIADEMDTGTA